MTFETPGIRCVRLKNEHRELLPKAHRSLTAQTLSRTPCASVRFRVAAAPNRRFPGELYGPAPGMRYSEGTEAGLITRTGATGGRKRCAL